MDPDWPVNPPETIICVLCKAAMPFYNRNPERFFRHLLADHCTYFNLNLLLEVSLLQPGAESAGERQVDPIPSPINEATSSHLQSHDYARKPVEPDSTSKSPSEHCSSRVDQEDTKGPLGSMAIDQAAVQDVGEFDLSYFVSNMLQSDRDPSAPSPNYNQPASSNGRTAVSDQITTNQNQSKSSSSCPKVPILARGRGRASPFNQTIPSIKTDSAALDPISVVPSESKNPNRHLVTEDLQNLIINQNPDREIKFTLSQRQNTQMVVDDYVLKKKKGPYKARGGRVVNWKCVHDSCQYTAVTWEGQIQDTHRMHNHAAQPELYIKKQARVKIRENIANEIQMSSVSYDDRPVTSAVYEVVNEADSEARDMIGSIDALKQAARRFNRKLLNKDVKPSTSSKDFKKTSVSQNSKVLVENLSNYEIVGEIPLDIRLSLPDPSSGVRVEVPHVTMSKVEPGDTSRGCIEQGVRIPVVEADSDQTFPGDRGDKDNIEELLETSPTKQERLADELISDC